MNVKSSAVLVILVAIGLVIANVRAEVDRVDEYFENVRGQLLQFYNSELISHAAIILGLIVGFPTIGGVIWNWKWLKRRHSFRHFLQAFVLLIAVTSLLFSFGRFFYWSALGTPLIHATREDVSVFLAKANVTSWELNVTSCMSALTDYAFAKLPSDTSPTTVLMRDSLSLTNPYVLPAVLIILLETSLTYTGIRIYYDHRHDPR